MLDGRIVGDKGFGQYVPRELAGERFLDRAGVARPASKETVAV